MFTKPLCDITITGEVRMKKLLVLVISLAITASLVTTPIWAAGGKVRGDKGSGATHQNDFNSQGNQSD